MTDPNTFIAIACFAGIVVLAGIQIWATTRNQRIAQHQPLTTATTALLFEFFDLDAEIQVKLWECYSPLLDSYLAATPSINNDELKKQTEDKLRVIEKLALRRIQSLTKCASLLPTEMYLAAQDLYKVRGRMISVLWDTKYEDKHRTLYVALLLQQQGFTARNALIAVTRRVMGIDTLTVNIPELWEQGDRYHSVEVVAKLKESLLRRVSETEQRKEVVTTAAMKETKEAVAATITETPMYRGKANSNGNGATEQGFVA